MEHEIYIIDDETDTLNELKEKFKEDNTFRIKNYKTKSLSKALKKYSRTYNC